jgi:uncharacterized membrane protein YfcA
VLIGLLIIGLFSGLMAGMFGLGGGVILVPAMVILLGFTQIAANGTSLVVLTLPVGIFGCLEYYRKGKLRLRPALAVGAALAVGSWFGAGIALGLSPQLLSGLYGAFLVYNGWRYMAPVEWWQERRGQPKPPDPEDTAIDPDATRTVLISAAIGFVAGIFAGLFGIGGGVIIITGLTLILGFDHKLATGTSLGALLLPVTAPSAYRYWLDGHVDFSVVIPLALTVTVGAMLGARVTLGLPAKTVRRAFGVFLLLVSVRFLLAALGGTA